MKTKISFIFAMVACIGIHTAAHSYTCTKLSSCPTNGGTTQFVDYYDDTGGGCANPTSICYQVEDGWATGRSIVEVRTCNSCVSSEYIHRSMTYTSPYCNDVITYQQCDWIDSTTTCGNTRCKSGSWWETNGAWATEKHEVCVSGSCVVRDIRTECARGYYDNGSGGCARCSSRWSVYGTTFGYGSAMEQDCYIPNGTTFNDTTGRGTLTGNCYWD